jgi:hypothetical protein
MAGKLVSFPFKVGYWLIGIALIAALAGCAPKIPPGMSGEDLQTCDDNAWEDEPLPYNYANLIAAHPFLAFPGDVDLWAPANGSLLPYGEPVPIKFDQPGATDGVLFRNYRVIVTSITGKILDRVGGEWAVVSMSSFNVQVTWTPPASGIYIIHVFIRNLETLDWLEGNPAWYSEELANPLGTYIHTGPFSVAHVCVQVDVPKAGEFSVQKPGTVVPVQGITVQVPTRTLTLTHTTTLIPSATLPLTPTLAPTFTPTFPPKLPTKTPTLVRPTDVPPTAVPACSTYLIDRDCLANDGCVWERQPTGGFLCQAK